MKNFTIKPNLEIQSPSQLLTLAGDSIAALENDEKYTLNMEFDNIILQNQPEGKMRLNMAGAVMVCLQKDELTIENGMVDLYWYSRPWVAFLKGLSLFSHGYVDGFLGYFNWAWIQLDKGYYWDFNYKTSRSDQPQKISNRLITPKPSEFAAACYEWATWMNSRKEGCTLTQGK